MAGAYPFASQLGIHTADPVTARFNFESCSIAILEDTVDANGIRGTRQHAVEAVRQGKYAVAGQIVLIPTAAELALILPWCLGAVASGTTFALADALTGRFIVVDQVIKVPHFSGVYVDKATFAATKNGPLKLTLDVVGQAVDSVGTAASFPALTLDTTTQPFIFTDGIFTTSSVATQAADFTLTVDNHIDRDRFFNSQTLQTPSPTDLTVSMKVDIPYGDGSAKYGLGIAGAAAVGVATTAVFTCLNTSLTFTMPAFVYPRKGPVIRGLRQEIMLELDGHAYKTGSTSALTLTLDSTP